MLSRERENGFVAWSEDLIGGARSRSLPPLKKRPPQAGAFWTDGKDSDLAATARDRRLPKLHDSPQVPLGGPSAGAAGRSELWQAFVGSNGQNNAASLQPRPPPSAGGGFSAPSTAGNRGPYPRAFNLNGRPGSMGRPGSRPHREKARPTPRGITATQKEARCAYNCIDCDIVESLEARVHKLVQRCEKVSLEEATGVYVLIERCHSCDQHHKLTTRHNEDHYKGLAQDLLKHLRHSAQGTIMEVGEMLCQLEATQRRLGSSYAHGLEIWHTASRVGAFEVYLLAPDLKLVEAEGVVVQFPESARDRAAAASRPGSPGGGQGSSWGAQLLLERCGYVATLLHSKLSSKSWPTAQQISQRLFASLPKAVITLHVLCPSGQPLPHFTVEVIEPEQSPQLQAPGQGQEEPLHMVIQATQGSCQIQEVPLHTPLQLRIYHSTMRVQTVSFVASRLRMNFAFGADIVFRLWAVEIPGGLAVCASVDHITDARLPENSKPFDGYVEVSEGDILPVKGRMQTPWESFRTGQQGSAGAFGMVRRIFVDGYHPAELELSMQTCTVHHLYQQECLEIAILAAPEVCLTVVLPGSRQPVANVRVEITAEQQRATTNDRGQCWIILRNGKHTLRLLHDDFTAEWCEQELIVDCMEPRLQVPLPLKLKIWRAPLVVCDLDLCAYDLWVAAAGSQPLPSWTPFTGDLSVAGSERLRIEAGTLSIDSEPVEVMDELSVMRPPSRDPLSKLSPLPPFSYRKEDRIAGNPFQNSLDFFTANLDQGPMHLGTSLREAPSLKAPEPGKAPASLVVRSMATCCGLPVGGIRVDVDDGQQTGVIRQDGIWEAAGLTVGEHTVEVTHAAFVGGAQRHDVCLARTDGRPELPLLFEACIYLFAVDGPGGRRLVQAAGSLSMIPADAMTFRGKIKTDAGELQCTPTMEAGRLQPVCVRIEANTSRQTSRCPVSSLQVTPEMQNYQWSAMSPPPLGLARCGLCQLIDRGPITLGSLRPLATATHIDGREIVFPIEDYGTISAVTSHLTELLNLAKDFPLALASEDSDGGTALPSDEIIRTGQRLCTLVCLEARVVFGASDIGILGATVVIDGRHLTHMRKTDVHGRCEFGVPAGLHTVTASHPMLGGAQTVSVELDSLFTTQCFVAKPRVTIYAVPDSESDSLAPTTVWVCSQPGHIPSGARSVAGVMRVRPAVDERLSSSIWEASFDSTIISPIDLEGEATPAPSNAGSSGLVLRPIPAGGLAFECCMGDHLWIPDGSPWLLEDAPSWTALLSAPLRVGVLRPPVTIRCHRLGEDLLQLLRLPADAYGTASRLCDAVAEKFGLEPSALAIYDQGLQLSPKDRVQACSEIDAWPLAALNIMVCTQCCSTGVEGVSVCLAQTYLKDGVPCSAALEKLMNQQLRITDRSGRFGTILTCDPETKICEVQFEDGSMELIDGNSIMFADEGESYTDKAGLCKIATNVGEHTVFLKHAAISTGQDGQMIAYADRQAKEERFCIEPKIFIFCIASTDAEDADFVQSTEVFMCSRSADVPENAQPVEGELHIPGEQGTVSVTLGGSPSDPILIRSVDNRKSRSPCPLLGLSIDIQVAAGQLWCPNEIFSADKVQCGHLQLLSKPICIGSVKPVVTVFCDTCAGGETLFVPLQECDTMESLRTWVAGKLDQPVDEIGIFNADGELEDDEFELNPGQEVYVGLLATLEIVVIMPEAASGDENPNGLEGVSIETDGGAAGSTDEFGSMELTARCGTRQVRLQHDCFGPKGRSLQDVVVKHGEHNKRLVIADVRVYIFASKADQDSTDEVNTPNAASKPSSPKTPPAPEADVGPLLVWICSSSSQIQGDMVPVSGRVSGTGLEGRKVSARLESGATELVLLNGEEAEAEVGENVRCTLSSLTFEVAKPGYCWRQRDPPPLVERAEEIGGCEYLRLLACPTVVGYLDPALCVESRWGKPVWLPVVESGAVRTVRQVKQYLQGVYDNAIPAEEMALCHCGSKEGPLEDSVEVQAGWMLSMMETAAVQLRVVTGCCCEPFDGVGIWVDGQLRGRTDAHGRIEELNLTSGIHKLRLEHVILGKNGFAMSEITVARGKANLFTILPDTRLFVYATDPDPEEYDDDAGEEEEEPMPDMNTALDSSCVWLAADPGHIPDDAVPLQGCVTCETAIGSQVSAMLTAKENVPVSLRLTSHDPSLIEPRQCKLASLKLACMRRGHCWLPKNPSPLVERLEEIGGCEFLRVLACPVSLGLLKPAVIVQCAGGLRLVLPLSAYSNFSTLREHIAQQLGTTDVDGLELETVDGTPFTDGSLQMPRHTSVANFSLCLLCKRRGESMQDARAEHERAEAAELEAAREADAAVAARAEREATQSVEVLEASTRETSWLAELSASMKDQ